MASKEHLQILDQGADKWNEWRSQTFGVIPDLSRANLTGISLAYVNFSVTNLKCAILKDAKLFRANFAESCLREANLSASSIIRTCFDGTQLEYADFSGAELGSSLFNNVNLSHVNFEQAKLTYVKFCYSILENANMSGSTMGYTVFAGIDLSTIRGLDMIKHRDASAISIDTIYESKGNIPESFLRGVGVSDVLIDYAHSLMEDSIKFYSCFISYSSKDQLFAERLYADLQNKGVRCWFAPEDLKIGEKIRTGIDESIRRHDKLLLVLSRASLESDWVEKEVETAMEREREQKRTVLFPVRLDDKIMKIQNGWAADIRRTRNIGDFKKWKDRDAYYQSFDRLLRDLKTERTN